MKTSDIKIEEDLAHIIWSRGVRSPPRKIRVRMSKTDEGYILVSPYTDEKETPAKEVKKETPKETPAKEVKKETPAKEVKEETPAKEVKKETPAKEVKKEAPKETPTKVKKETPAKKTPKKSK
jgi:large subunit ribosomal protein L31e